MIQDDPQGSLDLFRDALEATRRAIESDSRGAVQPNVDGSSPVGNYQVPADAPFMIEYAFVRPILLVPSETVYSEDKLVNLTVAFAIVLFNLAVSHHRQCLGQEELEVRSWIARARMFYVNTQSTLESFRSAIDRNSPGNALVDLIMMATFNNLAQMAFMLSEYQESQRHIRELVDYVAGSYEGEPSSLFDYHKSLFLFNVFIFQPPKAAAAA
jgi:hypothetical protein